MLTVTVTVFGDLTVVAPLVSCGTEVAANQTPPPFVDISHVEVEFQLPEAALLNCSFAEKADFGSVAVNVSRSNTKKFFIACLGFYSQYYPLWLQSINSCPGP